MVALWVLLLILPQQHCVKIESFLLFRRLQSHYRMQGYWIHDRSQLSRQLRSLSFPFLFATHASSSIFPSLILPVTQLSLTQFVLTLDSNHQNSSFPLHHRDHELDRLLSILRIQPHEKLACSLILDYLQNHVLYMDHVSYPCFTNWKMTWPFLVPTSFRKVYHRIADQMILRQPTSIFCGHAKSTYTRMLLYSFRYQTLSQQIQIITYFDISALSCPLMMTFFFPESLLAKSSIVISLSSRWNRQMYYFLVLFNIIIN